MNHSLQGRLLTLLLGTVLCIWVVASIALWRDVRHELNELLDGHLAQAAALLLFDEVQEGEDHAGSARLPLLDEEAPRVAFQVFRRGELKLRSANAPAEPMRSGRKFKSGFESITVDGAGWRVFAARRVERDIEVYVGEQAHTRNDILIATLRSALWPMVAVLPLLAIGAWFAVRRATAPLREIGQTLSARRPDDLTPVIVSDAPTEMTPMIGALNGLFERIQSSIDLERRFTADAAHELRTPIAAIRAQAEAAMGETEDGRRQHALVATLEGCDRAAHLVEQLLTLSRLEATTQPDFDSIDLVAVARGVVAETIPMAFGRDQSLELEAKEKCLRVSGNAVLLEVLIRNLVGNAIRYAGTAGRIRVRLHSEGDVALIAVEDSGPGMNQADIDRLGERFFRVLGNDESGSGLGWSIVRRIAEIHRATLHVGHSVMGGLAVTLQLGRLSG